MGIHWHQNKKRLLASRHAVCVAYHCLGHEPEMNEKSAYLVKRASEVLLILFISVLGNLKLLRSLPLATISPIVKWLSLQTQEPSLALSQSC